MSTVISDMQDLFRAPQCELYNEREFPHSDHGSGHDLPIFVINVTFSRRGANSTWGTFTEWPKQGKLLVQDLRERARLGVRLVYGINDPSLYEVVVIVCDDCPANAYQPMWKEETRAWIPLEHHPTRLYDLLHADAVFAIFTLGTRSLGTNVVGLCRMLKNCNADIHFLIERTCTLRGSEQFVRNVINAQDLIRAYRTPNLASSQARKILKKIRKFSKSRLCLSLGGNMPYEMGEAADRINAGKTAKSWTKADPDAFYAKPVSCPGQPCEHEDDTATAIANVCMFEHGDPDAPTLCNVCPTRHHLPTVKALRTHLKAVLEGDVECPARYCNWKGLGLAALRKHVVQVRHLEGSAEFNIAYDRIMEIPEEEELVEDEEPDVQIEDAEDDDQDEETEGEAYELDSN